MKRRNGNLDHSAKEVCAYERTFNIRRNGRVSQSQAVLDLPQDHEEGRRSDPSFEIWQILEIRSSGCHELDFETTKQRAIMTPLSKYQSCLFSFPDRGQGRHQHLLRIAGHGIRAGLKPEKIFSDIRQANTHGMRDKEIIDAIKKAALDNNEPYTLKPKPIVKDGKATLQRIIKEGLISDEADLWEDSPIRLWDEPQNDPAFFLVNMYKPEDLIFIDKSEEPGKPGYNIRTRNEWISYFVNGGKTAPHIIINPLTGKIGKTKDGKDSYRCDDAIATYRYCMAEFDDMSREDQILFWSAIKLPIRALIDTGGKSLHAWIDVSKLSNIKTLQDWQINVGGKLYDQGLIPLGIDSTCSNPSRFSRLPGHFREEKGKFQRILWLAEKDAQ
jgi:hypothetical protein